MSCLKLKMGPEAPAEGYFPNIGRKSSRFKVVLGTGCVFFVKKCGFIPGSTDFILKYISQYCDHVLLFVMSILEPFTKSNFSSEF